MLYNYDHTNNVIGYGTQLNTTSLDIPHILTSDNKFTTLIYGIGISITTAYSYSAGFSDVQSILINFHCLKSLLVRYTLLCTRMCSRDL